MNLKYMSKSELLEKFEHLVRTERKITAMVLEYISEIDRRKIYLEQAYPSLFEYLVQKHGYSRSAAGRRIAAARLMREIPAVASRVNEGSLNLSQLAKTQQAIQCHQESTNEKLSMSTKQDLLDKITGATDAQTQLILAQNLNFALPKPAKEIIHRDESVTIPVTFTKEQLYWIEKAKALVSHSVPGQEWNNVFTHLSKKEVKRRLGAGAA